MKGIHYALKRYELYLVKLEEATADADLQSCIRLTDHIEKQRTLYRDAGGSTSDPRWKSYESRFRDLKKQRPTPRQMHYLRGLGYEGSASDLSYDEAATLIQGEKDKEGRKQCRVAILGRLHRSGSIRAADVAVYGPRLVDQVLAQLLAEGKIRLHEHQEYHLA